MGLIGNEIVQSRIWVDPTAPPPPNLNYKNTFPITVFDAIRAEMNDENSITLKEVLELIKRELANKQPMITSRPANYIMTYAGTPGGIGAIQISQDIPWDPEQQRTDKIPTEKAVGKLLNRLGLTDDDGNIVEGEGKKIHWGDIIGRPIIYNTLGSNEDGFVTQKYITEVINLLKDQIRGNHDACVANLEITNKKLDDHRNNKNNPHDITVDKIGAVSREMFKAHIDLENPHHVTKEMIGLENVDNTSDLDKPISNATQEALDRINQTLETIDDLNFIHEIKYDRKSGKLTIIYRDDSEIDLFIPIDGLLDEISYDEDRKELILTELGGYQKRVNVTDLFVRYLGSRSPHITVTIDNERSSGNHVISATINPHSITATELAEGAVNTSMIIDNSITGDKIHDLTITTIKYADNSITTEKIAELAITNSRLDTRSVDGRVLFSSNIDNRVLAVLQKGSNPVWTQITSDMIDIDAIASKHIINKSISTEKIADTAITTRTISDLAVTNSKISPASITNDKICNATITGNKIVENPEFTGTPKITVTPSGDANNHDIPDTRWVLDRIRDMIITNSNLGDRIVDGRALFSSNTRNKALIVTRANSDPFWGLINHDMIDIDAIDTNQIIDQAITNSKIDNNAITARNLSTDSVFTDHIKNQAVTSEKIFPSNRANRVLAALRDYGTPEYSQVTRQMIENNAISSLQIEDRSVTLSKIQSSDESNQVLAVTLKKSDPIWTKVTGSMIADRSIEGRNIFTSSGEDRILGVINPGDDPSWLKITSKMISDGIIQERHMSSGSINSSHLQEGIIEAKHIADKSITADKLQQNTITADKIISSPYPNRVLAVKEVPYSNPDWLQIATEMIEDKAITKEKIFQSSHPYRVLAATQGGVPPEYTMITHEFIVDGTIIPSKLVKNFALQGTPELTLPPVPEADNHQIPDTAWVRKTVANMINDFNPEILFDTITTEMIGEHVVDGTKLFTHPYGPRVLGITKANEDVEFLLIEEDLIADGAVTSNKIDRSVQLHGSPTLEVRPSPYASDNRGGGQLIPDCQWVLDRIKESIGNGSGGDSPIIPDNPGSDWEEIDQPTVNLHWGQNGDGPNSSLEQEITLEMVQSAWNTNGDGPDTSDLNEITKPHVTHAWDTDGLIPYEGDDGSNPDLDDILSGGTGLGSGNNSGIGSILPGSITTDFIQDRSITSEKLFTSVIANRVLSVLESNGDPQYTKINHEMLEDRIIDAQKFFTSDVENRILAITQAGKDAVWTQVTLEMMSENSIDTGQIIDRSVTTEKIANFAITKTKLARIPMIDKDLLEDGVITTQKIVNHAVETDKIADHAITSEKISPEIQLPAYTTVSEHENYEKRSLRNTILSPNAPSGGKNGDIWFRYI